MLRILIGSLVLLATAFLGGCGASSPLVLSDTHNPQTVHIITDTANLSTSSDSQVMLGMLDGQPTKTGASLKRMPEEAYVAAGEHVLGVSYVSMMFGSSSAHLRLDAQSGHLYVIHHHVRFPEHRVAFWITDGQHGPVVGGIAD